MKLSTLFLAAFVATSTSACGQSATMKPTPTADSSAASFRNVSVAEADKLLKADKSIVVLDVRTADEFSAGRIPGATNLDFYAQDFKAKLGGLDRDKTYLLHCKTGGRSAKTDAMMKEFKFKSVLHLKDGFDGWESAGKPVEK